MATIKELLVKITASSTGLDRELTTALGKTKRFGAEMTNIGTSLAIGVSAPILGVGAAAVKAAADMDALERGLKATTKEAGPLTGQLERLRNIAKMPGLGFQEAVQGSINLQAVGYSAATSEKFLRVFGNALASVGRGRADLDGVIVQLQQMAGKSKVLAEDVKPLIQRIPQLGAAMLKLYGSIDTEQLQKMGVSSKQFVSDIVGELEKLPQATGGVKNAFENLADSSNQALARVGKVLVENFELDKKLDALGKAAENVGLSFSRMSPFAQNATVGLAGVAAGAPLAAIAIGTLIEKTGTVIGFFRNWESAAVSLKFALGALAAAGIYAVIAAYRQWSEAQAGAEKAQASQRDSLALLEVRLRQAGVNIQSLSDEYRKGQLTQEQYAAALRKLALATGELVKPKVAIADATKNYAANVKTATAALEEFGGPIRKTTAEFERQLEAYERLDAAQRRYREALASTADIADIPMPDVQSADQAAASKANLDAWEKSKRGVDGLSDALKRGEELYGKAKKAAKDSGETQATVWSEVDREVNKAFGHMARGMADSIVQWKGFGETLKGVAKSFASGILEIMIQRLFAPLKAKLADVLGGIGTDAATGVIKNATGGAAGAAGSAAGGAGKAGSAAASSLMGTLTAVFSGVSAVTGVIGAFQMAGMNKSLDLVVKHTLQTANDLANLRADEWAREAHSMAKLDDLAQFTWRKMDDLINAVREGGNAKIQIVLDGKVLAQSVARTLPTLSPSFG